MRIVELELRTSRLAENLHLSPDGSVSKYNH